MSVVKTSKPMRRPSVYGVPYSERVLTKTSSAPAISEGVIIGSGVYEPGKVRGTPAMAQAYEMGRSV